MIIREITLQNFRQYKNVTLDLRCQEGKNVIIVKGEGGAGKTTFTQAFRWCLYGVTTFRDAELLNKDVADTLILGNSTTVSVTMRISTQAMDYALTRSLVYTMKKTGLKANDSSVIEVREESRDRKVLGKHEAELLIRSLLPKQLAPYFFFDGERMQNMVEELLVGKGEDIGNVVRGMVGFSSLESLLRHLKKSRNTTVLKKIEKEIDNCGSAEFGKLSKQIEDDTSKIEDTLEKIDAIENKLERARKEERNLELELSTYQDVEALQQQWEENKNRKEEYERQKEHKQKMYMKNFQSEFSRFTMIPMMMKCKGILREDDLSDKGVPDICNTTLDFLIERDMCLCGKKLSENPDCMAEIKKLYEYVPPKSAGTMIREMIETIETETARKDTFFDNMQEFVDSIDDLSEQADIEEQKNQLIDQNMLKQGDEIKALKQKQLALSDTIKADNMKVKVWSQQLGELRSRNKSNIEEREKLINANAASVRWKRYRAYAEAIYENVLSQYSENEKEQKEIFDGYINEFIYQIYGEEIKIEVSNAYKIKVLNGLELSTSQYYSIVIAFIATTLKMAKERKSSSEGVLDYPEEYPLVMDAPLSAFDKSRIRIICSLLPQIAEQVVIFIKDTDGDLAEQYMYDSIATRYEIVKNFSEGTDSSVKEVR